MRKEEKKEKGENKGKRDIYLHIHKIALKASSSGDSTWQLRQVLFFFFYLLNILKHFILFEFLKLSEYSHVLHNNDTFVNDKSHIRW